MKLGRSKSVIFNPQNVGKKAKEKSEKNTKKFVGGRNIFPVQASLNLTIFWGAY